MFNTISENRLTRKSSFKALYRNRNNTISINDELKEAFLFRPKNNPPGILTSLDAMDKKENENKLEKLFNYNKCYENTIDINAIDEIDNKPIDNKPIDNKPMDKNIYREVVKEKCDYSKIFQHHDNFNFIEKWFHGKKNKSTFLKLLNTGFYSTKRQVFTKAKKYFMRTSLERGVRKVIELDPEDTNLLIYFQSMYLLINEKRDEEFIKNQILLTIKICDEIIKNPKLKFEYYDPDNYDEKFYQHHPDPIFLIMITMGCLKFGEWTQKTILST